MTYIRATYNGSTVTSVDDSSTLATNYTKYWNNQNDVSDSPGIWDTTTNKYVPDGWHDNETNIICPDQTAWEEYDASN